MTIRKPISNEIGCNLNDKEFAKLSRLDSLELVVSDNNYQNAGNLASAFGSWFVPSMKCRSQVKNQNSVSVYTPPTSVRRPQLRDLSQCFGYKRPKDIDVTFRHYKDSSNYIEQYANEITYGNGSILRKRRELQVPHHENYPPIPTMQSNSSNSYAKPISRENSKYNALTLIATSPTPTVQKKPEYLVSQTTHALLNNKKRYTTTTSNQKQASKPSTVVPGQMKTFDLISQTLTDKRLFAFEWSQYKPIRNLGEDLYAKKPDAIDGRRTYEKILKQQILIQTAVNMIALQQIGLLV